MKTPYILLLVALMAYSCCKEKPKDMARPKASVRVEVTAESQSTVQITSGVSQSFKGRYVSTFTTDQDEINVHMYSFDPCMKTITIYVDGKEAARRSGSCPVTDYDLSYDLSSYY